MIHMPPPQPQKRNVMLPQNVPLKKTSLLGRQARKPKGRGGSQAAVSLRCSGPKKNGFPCNSWQSPIQIDLVAQVRNGDNP